MTKARMTTVLEGYDYDLERFTIEREWEGDLCDAEAAKKCRALVGIDGEAWRLLVYVGADLHRVVWLSRPDGF